MGAQYYAFLTEVMRFVSDPLTELSYNVNVPILAALVLGLLGATSPCQLSTNLAALAYVSRRLDRRGGVMRSALAYLLGKMTVYALVGSAIILLGLQLDQMAVPVVIAARKLLGPLLILLGLFMLGVLRSNLSLGAGLGQWFERQGTTTGGLTGAYLLGVGFSFAFCPTLFWLFFGLLIPLAIASTGGIVFPGVFALGTTLPLLFFAGLMALGIGGIGRIMGQVKRLDRWMQKAVGALFVLVGINEIVLYWFL